MLKVKTYPHIDDSEISRLCGQSVIDDIYRYYEVKNCTSVSFGILTEEEMKEIEEDEYDWFHEKWKLTLTKTLLENGFKHGDTVYIDIFW